MDEIRFCKKFLILGGGCFTTPTLTTSSFSRPNLKNVGTFLFEIVNFKVKTKLQDLNIRN